MKVANTYKRSIIVGIFIFLGIVILVATVLTLGGQKKVFQSSITLKALFDDVEGLQIGNNIWFSGVKIGTVKKIAFYGTSQVEVDINIQESSQEYIRKDAKAKISSDGIIGNRIVVIFGGTDKSPQVEEGDVLRVDKAVTTDEMMNTLQSNNKNLVQITEDFKVISKRLTEGKGTIGKLLTDESLFTEMETIMGTLSQAAANTEKVTTAVSNYTSLLNKKGTLADNLVNDTVIFARLKATTARITEMSNTANAVVEDLKKTSESINKGLNNKRSPAGMLLNDEGVANELKSTLHNLNTSTQKLDENMEALQHNFLLRGFFRKKAKREAEAAENQ